MTNRLSTILITTHGIRTIYLRWPHFQRLVHLCHGQWAGGFFFIFGHIYCQEHDVTLFREIFNIFVTLIVCWISDAITQF